MCTHCSRTGLREPRAQMLIVIVAQTCYTAGLARCARKLWAHAGYCARCSTGEVMPRRAMRVSSNAQCVQRVSHGEVPARHCCGNGRNAQRTLSEYRVPRMVRYQRGTLCVQRFRSRPRAHAGFCAWRGTGEALQRYWTKSSASANDMHGSAPARQPAGRGCVKGRKHPTTRACRVLGVLGYSTSLRRRRAYFTNRGLDMDLRRTLCLPRAYLARAVPHVHLTHTWRYLTHTPRLQYTRQALLYADLSPTSCLLHADLADEYLARYLNPPFVGGRWREIGRMHGGFRRGMLSGACWAADGGWSLRCQPTSDFLRSRKTHD